VMPTIMMSRALISELVYFFIGRTLWLLVYFRRCAGCGQSIQ